MKKNKFSIIVLLAMLSFSVTFAFASDEKSSSKLTIKNTVGGNSEDFGDYDLYSYQRQTDINGDTVSENVFGLGDRFQLDFTSKFVDARFRLDTLYSNASVINAAESSLIFAPSGFVHYEPVKQFGIIAGTNFYKKFVISSAYMAAADDTTKYGRLLTDSLGYDGYIGNETVALYTNGFCGGITSDWTFGDFDEFYLKAAAGGTFAFDTSASDVISEQFEYALDCGINFGMEKGFDLGFTAHNFLSDDRKFAAFAGLTAVNNLILNASFYYNFTDSDYLCECRVERSGEYKYKKQTTKYAAGISGGYLFEDVGFGIYADMIMGLTNEYIGEVKYYDKDGNLLETVTKTIIRGGTVVKYKNGKAKRTDEFVHDAIPFYMQLRLTYDVTEDFNTAFNIKLRTMMNDASESWITLYPRCAIDLPSKAGEIDLGAKLDFNLSRYEGLSSISIPISYTYKFKKKFS